MSKSNATHTRTGKGEENGDDHGARTGESARGGRRRPTGGVRGGFRHLVVGVCVYQSEKGGGGDALLRLLTSKRRLRRREKRCRNPGYRTLLASLNKVLPLGGLTFKSVTSPHTQQPQKK